MRSLEGVRELRELRMLTQQELANRAGVSLFTIQRIERGDGAVRPKTGRAVAAALGVPVAELLPKETAPRLFTLEATDEGRHVMFSTLAIIVNEHNHRLAHCFNQLPENPSREELEKGVKLVNQYVDSAIVVLDAMTEGGVSRLLVQTLTAADQADPIPAAELQAAHDLQSAVKHMVLDKLPALSSWVQRGDEQERIDEWRREFAIAA